VGAGKFALAGSATVNVLNETTKASIGQGAVINETTTDAAGSQDVRVVAYDDTDILSVAGALSGAGTFGLGDGADVAVITKDTQAYVWAEQVTARGDVKVQADSSEDFCSISASLGGAGTLAIAGSAGVYVLDIRAFIGDARRPDHFDRQHHGEGWRACWCCGQDRRRTLSRQHRQAGTAGVSREPWQWSRKAQAFLGRTRT
jgi:hypothetical protein